MPVFDKNIFDNNVFDVGLTDTRPVPILKMLGRRGERVWFRRIVRNVDYSSGEPTETYLDNQSCMVRIVENLVEEVGGSIVLNEGNATLYGKPFDFWRGNMKAEVNDLLIRQPDNYSSGTATIWRIDEVETMPLRNQSQLYVKLNLKLSAAKE